MSFTGSAGRLEDGTQVTSATLARVRPLDTTPEAWAVQLRIWRDMGASKRLSAAVQLSEELVELARAGIAARHPEYDAESVRFAEIRQRLGDELFAKAFPNAPRLDP